MPIMLGSWALHVKTAGRALQGHCPKITFIYKSNPWFKALSCSQIMPASTKYRGMSHECHDVSLNCHGPSWSWNGIPRMKWNVTRNVASVMENHGTWDQYLLQATMEQPCDKYHGPCCHGQLPSCHHRTCQHVIQVPCLVPSSAGPKQCLA